MIGSSRRPIVRVVAEGDGHVARCGTQGCEWLSGPHVVKAAAEEAARWHRETHRRSRV